MRTRVLAACAAALLAGCAPEPASGPYVVTLDLEPTLAQLGADAPEERDAAVERLAALGSAAVPVLTRAAGDPRPGVAEGAVEALGAASDPTAAAALARIAAGGFAPAVRAAALAALASDGEETLVRAALEDALASGDPVVQLTAAGLCGSRCTSPAATERLVALALADGTPPGEALRARTSVERLLAAADAEVAGRTQTLVAARVPARLASAGSDDERAVAGLLGLEVGVPGAEAAVATAAARSANVGIRLAAVRALGTHGGPPAVGVVAAALDRPGVHAAALEALRRLSARGVAEAATVLAARQDAAGATGVAAGATGMAAAGGPGRAR